MSEHTMTVVGFIIGIVAFVTPIVVFVIKTLSKLNALSEKVGSLIDNSGPQKLAELINSDTFQKLTRLPPQLMDDLRNLDAITRYVESQKQQEEMRQRIHETRPYEPIMKIHEAIEGNDKLLRRFNENSGAKAFLKSYLTDTQLVQEVLANEDSIFIESGSTLSYAAIAFVQHVKETRPDRPLKICTNNIIVYIYCLFQEHIHAVLLPGSSTNSYGATFGDPLDPNSCNRHAVRSFLVEHEVTTLFTTSSVLDAVYGPHVSSGANRDIKSVLSEYADEHRCLNIHIVASEKVNTAIAEGKAHEECKLTFDERGSAVGNTVRLNEVSALWREFLAKPHNCLLIGSDNRKVTKDAVRILQQHHPGLQPILSKQSSGLIALLRPAGIRRRGKPGDQAAINFRQQ